jgi:phosphomevalonate kinase
MEEVRTVVSAPGKVLLTGGYLVLQRPFAGLVLSLSSRFRAVVAGSRPSNRSVRVVHVQVDSPQFETTSPYVVSFDEEGKVECRSSNPYVSNALKWSLAFVRHRQRPLGNFHVTLVADNDFYSMLDELQVCFFVFVFFFLIVIQSVGVFRSPPSRLLLFLLTCVWALDMSAMRKTGLGSSAALVTSLVAAVCVHFGAADVSIADDLEQLHQLAQFAHCLAQGKIGSGFDVSSATFGSQKYVRFSPSHLDVFLRAAEEGKVVSLSNLFRRWDNVHDPLSLPKGMHLVLGDVSVGSNTPLMVSKVEKKKMIRRKLKKGNKKLTFVFVRCWRGKPLILNKQMNYGERLILTMKRYVDVLKH